MPLRGASNINCPLKFGARGPSALMSTPRSLGVVVIYVVRDLLGLGRSDVEDSTDGAAGLRGGGEAKDVWI